MNESLASAIVGHLVGDYLLQPHWMAIGKKSSNLICIIHCFLWTLCVTSFAGWHSFIATFVLYSSHFLQDRTTIIKLWMNTIGQRKFAEPPLGPWSVIVVDNVWHILTIWIVWRFIA